MCKSNVKHRMMFPVGGKTQNKKKSKETLLSSGQLKILSKLQHLAEVLVILNNGWSCLKVAGISFFGHNENRCRGADTQ